MPTTQVVLQLGVFFALLLVLSWPLGKWLAAIAEGRLPGWMSPLARVESALYRASGVDASKGMTWKGYALAIVAFNVLGVLRRLRAAAPARRGCR